MFNYCNYEPTLPSSVNSAAMAPDSHLTGAGDTTSTGPCNSDRTEVLFILADKPALRKVW
jgi:hypothetical protein